MKNLFSKYWVSDFAMNSNGHKSFGKVSAADLLAALKANYKNKPGTDLAIWVKESGYLSGMPPELYMSHDVDSFKMILGNYNGEIQSTVDYLSKPDGFYLWLHA